MANNILTTDNNTNSVTMDSFELLGPVGEKLFAPRCVAVSSTGEYVVSDHESCFIVIYSNSGDYLSHFSTIPKSYFYFNFNLDKHRPHDVAWLSSKKIVYTQPWGSKVTISNWKGNVTLCIEGKPLYQPFGLAVDQLDQIYITDREKGRLLCYSSEGKLLKTFGGLASNGFSLTCPHYIGITNLGDIVINDSEKDYIYLKIIDRKTSILKTLSFNTNLCASSLDQVGPIALDSKNRIFQACHKRNTIFIFSIDKKDCSDFSCETLDLSCIKDVSGIATSSNGNLVCIDNDDKTIKIFPIDKLYPHCNGHTSVSNTCID